MVTALLRTLGIKSLVAGKSVQALHLYKTQRCAAMHGWLP